MKERPILFSGSMVRAILRGEKTQTRRVLLPRSKPGFGLVPKATIAEHREFWDLCPYGQPGDRLWVRETWFDTEPFCEMPLFQGRSRRWAYRADKAEFIGCHRWRPSIHMPRRASRITLEVVSVRVERVQAISRADAAAEGLSLTPGDPRGYFPATWNLINSRRGYSWEANPWVWAVGFKVMSLIPALCPSVPSATSVVGSPA